MRKATSKQTLSNYINMHIACE